MSEMKKFITTIGLTAVIVLAGAAIFANASQNDVTEEGVLGVTTAENNLKVVEPKQKAEATSVEKQTNASSKQTPKLSIDEAIAIAMTHADGQVTEVELERDRGKLYYDIEIEDGKYEYEIEIDAQTGDVLEFEKEYED